MNTQISRYLNIGDIAKFHNSILEKIDNQTWSMLMNRDFECVNTCNTYMEWYSFFVRLISLIKETHLTNFYVNPCKLTVENVYAFTVHISRDMSTSQLLSLSYICAMIVICNLNIETYERIKKHIKHHNNDIATDQYLLDLFNDNHNFIDVFNDESYALTIFIGRKLDAAFLKYKFVDWDCFSKHVEEQVSKKTTYISYKTSLKLHYSDYDFDSLYKWNELASIYEIEHGKSEIAGLFEKVKNSILEQSSNFA